MSQPLIAELKRMIAQDLDVDLRVEDIDERKPLLDDGLGFDSIMIMEFITMIEDRLGFKFDDADLKVDSFKSLQALAELIERRRGSGPSVLAHAKTPAKAKRRRIV